MQSATWRARRGLDEPSEAPLVASRGRPLDSFVEIGLVHLSPGWSAPVVGLAVFTRNGHGAPSGSVSLLHPRSTIYHALRPLSAECAIRPAPKAVGPSPLARCDAAFWSYDERVCCSGLVDAADLAYTKPEPQIATTDGRRPGRCDWVH
ncbi:MAG TPA: hypothetical protein VFR23_08690 [Jiangellaceae bacterium]|nr:hypothetical protein [Jiangellaceae bacterium]